MDFSGYAARIFRDSASSPGWFYGSKGSPPRYVIPRM